MNPVDIIASPGLIAVESCTSAYGGGIELAQIVPFRGLRYNTEKAGKMADLITPPYDVIDDRQQKSYYKNPYNIIRLNTVRQEPMTVRKITAIHVHRASLMIGFSRNLIP